MGKNYSTQGYRKSYEGDYTKEYQNETLVKKVNAERKRSYDLISKKIGTTTYTKGEKVLHDIKATPEKNGKIVADHSSKAISIDIIDKKDKRIIQQTQTISANRKITESKQTTIPPPFHNKLNNVKVEEETKVRLKQPPRKNKYDLSYIDVNSNKLPIERVDDHQYKDVYTGDILNVYEARKRLEYVGFTQSPLFPTPIVIGLVMFGFLFPFIGPIMLYTIGNGLIKRTNMLFVKNANTPRAQRIEMPLLKEDMDDFKRKKTLLRIVAVLSVLFQFYVFY